VVLLGIVRRILFNYNSWRCAKVWEIILVADIATDLIIISSGLHISNVLCKIQVLVTASAQILLKFVVNDNQMYIIVFSCRYYLTPLFSRHHHENKDEAENQANIFM
jgi:hypothetical protein